MALKKQQAINTYIMTWAVFMSGENMCVMGRLIAYALQTMVSQG